jgi:hypothetical protein
MTTGEKVGETAILTDEQMRALMIQKLEATMVQVRAGDAHQLCIFLQDAQGVTHAYMMMCTRRGHAVMAFKDIMGITGEALLDEMISAGMLEALKPAKKDVN